MRRGPGGERARIESSAAREKILKKLTSVFYSSVDQKTNPDGQAPNALRIHDAPITNLDWLIVVLKNTRQHVEEEVRTTQDPESAKLVKEQTCARYKKKAAEPPQHRPPVRAESDLMKMISPACDYC